MIETTVNIHPHGRHRGFTVATVRIVNTDPPSADPRYGNYFVTVEERDAITNTITDDRHASIKDWRRENNVLELVRQALEACGYDAS